MSRAFRSPLTDQEFYGKNSTRGWIETPMVRGLILAAVALAAVSVARAADLVGVSMPEVLVTDGRAMRLNGIGLRTYSILGIPIYVAGSVPWNAGAITRTLSCIHQNGNCSTSDFSGMWAWRMLEPLGGTPSGRTARPRAILIAAMCSDFWRRCHLSTRVTRGRCCSPQRGSWWRSTGDRWARSPTALCRGHARDLHWC